LLEVQVVICAWSEVTKKKVARKDKTLARSGLEEERSRRNFGTILVWILSMDTFMS